MTRTAGARTRNAVAACAVVLVALGSAGEALGATITVTTEADAVASDGVCSLREAVTSANNDAAPFAGAGECAPGSGADTVALPAGRFELTRAGAPLDPSDDLNAFGDLDLLGTEVTIAGAGATATTIDANAIDRAIDVRTGRIATVRGVTVTGGHAQDGRDGANATGPTPGDSATGQAGDPGEPGGGIRNLGTLTVVDSTISGNAAGSGGTGGTGTGANAAGFPGFGRGGDAGAGGSGGGIFNSGVLTVVRSTVTANVAGAGGNGGFGQGGSATGSNGMGASGTGETGGTGGDGGGIASGAGGTATIEDSSITANAAGAGGRGGLGQGGNGGPAGFMSTANGGMGGQGNGGLGGFGGGGGGVSGPVNATRVLIHMNAAGAAGDGGNGTGSVGGPALGTAGNGGNGGMGQAGNGGLGGAGGGVLSNSFSLVASTVSANATGAGGDGGNGTGGGGGGALNGTGGNGGVGDAGSGNPGGNGGGVRTSGNPTIRQATISSNQLAVAGGAGTPDGGPAGQPGGSEGVAAPGSPGSVGTGGGVSANAPMTLSGSIVSGNAAPSCNAQVQDGGHNVVFPDTTCPGLNADPMLGALADNGGPTQTQAIAPGSPALDLAPAGGSSCSPTDQRVVPRPFGPACDAGAYEWAPPSVVTGAATTLSSTTAALTGTVNPNARGSSFHFELGTTTAYGRSTTLRTLDAGVAAVAADATVGELVEGVTYHYRLVASNSDGTSFGEDRTFVIADRVRPRFLSASIVPKVFAVNRRGRAERPVAGQRPRRGTRFRFRLSERARVVFTISRARPGRRVRGRCVKPTPRNRTRRRCTRYVRVRAFAMQARAGSNTKRFSGKIGRRSLKPGRYRATLVATDAAGNRSAPRRLRFRVVRAR